MSNQYGPRIITDGLVSCFDFYNTKSYSGTGTDLMDISGFANSGITENAPSFISNYFNLNGTTQRLRISPQASTIRTYNSTTCFLVNIPLWSGGQRCIMSYRGSGAGNMYVAKASNGIFIYYNELNEPAYTVGSLAANQNYFVSIVCDASNNLLDIYVNGQSITGGGVSRTGWVTNYATTYIYLGYDAGGTNEYMSGRFYSFQHYNKVLTSSEILQNYNALKGRFSL